MNDLGIYMRILYILHINQIAILDSNHMLIIVYGSCTLITVYGSHI